MGRCPDSSGAVARLPPIALAAVDAASYGAAAQMFGSVLKRISENGRVPSHRRLIKAIQRVVGIQPASWLIDDGGRHFIAGS